MGSTGSLRETWIVASNCGGISAAVSLSRLPLLHRKFLESKIGIEGGWRTDTEHGRKIGIDRRSMMKKRRESERGESRHVACRSLSKSQLAFLAVRPSVARFVAHSFQFAVTLERPFPDAKGVRSPSPALNSLANFLAINWRGGSCRLD